MALHFRMKKTSDSDKNLNSEAGDVKRRHQVADWGKCSVFCSSCWEEGGLPSYYGAAAEPQF